MSVSDLLKGADVTLTCPDCDEKIVQKLGGLETDEHVTCPGCGRAIRLDGGESISAAKEEAQEGIADFMRKAKKAFDEIT